MSGWSFKYVALFVAIQLASLVLTLIGYPLIAVLALFKLWEPMDAMQNLRPSEEEKQMKYRWKCPWLTFLWSNREDGIFGNGPITRWQAFYWSALRNSCNNLRYVRGVSAPGRPLWHWSNGSYYAQLGWLGSNGQPVLSAGRGGGY